MDYKRILREAFERRPESTAGMYMCAARVYVEIFDKEHLKGVEAAAKSLGILFQRKPHYGLSPALYIGLDNGTGAEYGKGMAVATALRAAGIKAHVEAGEN